MRLFVTGINGFIGTHLLDAVLTTTDWQVSGFDIASTNLAPYEGNSQFSFRRGDIFKDNEALEAEVIKSDAVIPLAGIAKPAYYVKKPVWTFELDFEQNLKMVRLCVKHNKRIIFPSTSEVYGMSSGEELKEDESPLTTGPVVKMRWIYSCAKQMMDRMIFAYGYEAGLQFTIFRPFDWIGPRLDTKRDAEERRARSVTQMLYDMIHRRRISLVNGGEQRRAEPPEGPTLGETFFVNSVRHAISAPSRGGRRTPAPSATRGAPPIPIWSARGSPPCRARTAPRRPPLSFCRR